MRSCSAFDAVIAVMEPAAPSSTGSCWWKNDAPSIQTNLWGDDPFPAVDSNWDQPSKSFVVSLNQTLGNTATNTLQFSYSANKIEITRGGEDLSIHDAVVNSLPNLLEAARQRPDVFEVVLPTFGPKTYFSWAGRKDADSAALNALMDTELRKLSESGKLAELQKKWFGATMELPTDKLPEPAK